MQLHSNMVSRRGQIASLDLGTSFLTILAILTITLSYNYMIIESSSNLSKRVKAKKKIYEATESFLTTSGKPLNWQEPSTDIERIGVAEHKHKSILNHDMDSKKIQAIKQMPLENLKRYLGLEEGNISIKIEQLNGKEILNKGNLEKGYLITRIASMEGDLYTIELRFL